MGGTDGKTDGAGQDPAAEAAGLQGAGAQAQGEVGVGAGDAPGLGTPGAAPPAQAGGSDAAGLGDGRAPGADAGTEPAPPAAGKAPEAEVEEDDGDDGEDDDQDEDEEDDDDGEELEAEALDPEIEKLRPTLTHDQAFDLAVNVAIRAAYPEDDVRVHEALDHARMIEAHGIVFDRLRLQADMPAETAYRMLREVAVDLPPWGEHLVEAEIGLTVFVAVASTLIAIADTQLAAFEEAIVEAKRGDQLQAMRQRRAGRRAKRAERKARAPAAARKMLEIRARNREIEEAAKGKPPAPTRPAAKSKAPAKSSPAKKGKR